MSKKNTVTELNDFANELNAESEVRAPAPEERHFLADRMPTEVIGTTPIYSDEEAKAEAFRLKKIAASRKMLARKAEAIAKLVDLAERLGNEEEKKAAQYMKGGRQLGIVTPKNEVIEYLTIHGPKTPDEIWMKFKLGNYEMKKVLKAGAKFDGIAYSI